MDKVSSYVDVLSPFAEEERDEVARSVERAAAAVERIVTGGLVAAMEAFNGQAK